MQSSFLTPDLLNGMAVRRPTEQEASTVFLAADYGSGFYFSRAGAADETVVARVTAEGDLIISGDVYSSVDGSKIVANPQENRLWTTSVVDGQNAVTLLDAVRNETPRVRLPGVTLHADALRGSLPFTDVTDVPLGTSTSPGLLKLNGDVASTATDVAATPSAVNQVSLAAQRCLRRDGSDAMSGDLVLSSEADLRLLGGGGGGRIGVGLPDGTSPAYAIDVNGDVNFTGRLLKDGVEVVIPVSMWQRSGSRVYLENGAHDIRVGLGTTDPTRTLHVAGDLEVSGDTYNGGVKVTHPWVNQPSGGGDVTYTGPGNVGIGVSDPSYRLHVDGGIYASGRILQLSDARFKSNAMRISSPLDSIRDLNGYTFQDAQGNARAGVLAQEVAKVLPEATASRPPDDREEDRTEPSLSVEYNGIIALLIESVKALDAEVKQLRTEMYATCRNNEE